ncbi:Mhf1p [Lachancea thermotolerans CBS 6340]|uniref:KLTH0G15642p n=1 Tax=Lachancea thermotolerans (strain ATCC 56472 / CBS 6340 / NRRL Y-8284) TaxID=559295 RepID=C5DNB5_LACTC|nr:KLTH0G15642p [Lachancea thermotolerans CBS 6340]CAR25276.1 KLTH0G15642p [Lachancea thermotolerans CBS 6340]
MSEQNSTSDSHMSEEQKQQLIPQLKGKLWYCLEQLVKKELPSDISYSPKFINALVELCFTQLVDIGGDLEAFARHAGRETIVVEDLMLRLRNSSDLQQLLQQKLEENTAVGPARRADR